MTKEVLINRLELAARLMASPSAISKRRGMARLMTTLQDLKQYEFPYACKPVDYKTEEVLQGINDIIRPDTTPFMMSRELTLLVINPLKHT